MKNKSNGPRPAACNVLSNSMAGPRMISTRSATPASQIHFGDFHVLRVDFQRDDLAIRRHCSSQPDRAVAAQRTDLQDPLGADHSRNEMQEFSEVRRDGDLWQPGREARCERRADSRIRLNDQVRKIAIDFGPEFFVHRHRSPQERLRPQIGQGTPEPLHRAKPEHAQPKYAQRQLHEINGKHDADPLHFRRVSE